MNNAGLNDRQPTPREQLDELLALREDVRDLLDKMRARKPEHSAASPVAVIAVFELQDAIEGNIRVIRTILGEDDFPF